MHSTHVIRLLEEDGWEHVATRGDHHQYRHPEKPGKVTVPHPQKDLSIELVKSIERQSCVSLRRRN